jgi:hypothetical protein
MPQKRKPISIEAAKKRKKKQSPVSYYSIPQSDDWKPDQWTQMWQMVYEKALPYMMAYIKAQQEQAA